MRSHDLKQSTNTNTHKRKETAFFSFLAEEKCLGICRCCALRVAPQPHGIAIIITRPSSSRRRRCENHSSSNDRIKAKKRRREKPHSSSSPLLTRVRRLQRRRQLWRLLAAIDSLSQSVICALPLSHCLPADVTTSSTWSCSFFFYYLVRFFAVSSGRVTVRETMNDDDDDDDGTLVVKSSQVKKRGNSSESRPLAWPHFLLLPYIPLVRPHRTTRRQFCPQTFCCCLNKKWQSTELQTIDSSVLMAETWNDCNAHKWRWRRRCRCLNNRKWAKRIGKGPKPSVTLKRDERLFLRVHNVTI